MVGGVTTESRQTWWLVRSAHAKCCVTGRVSSGGEASRPSGRQTDEQSHGSLDLIWGFQHRNECFDCFAVFDKP